MDHYITHVPYRSWCPHCVAAAAKASPHKKVDGEKENSVPSQHVDYWFMRDQPGGESIPVVVMKDSDSKAIGAHVVSQKGNIEWVAEKMCEDIEEFGHCGKIIVKSDQENALVDLIKEVKKKRENKNRETLFENSKVYDSQSNGEAERAVQSVECIVRTHKLALEKSLNRVIPCKHPIMTWLVEHSVNMLNKYRIGPDGRTPHERIKGKRYKGEMYRFGSKVYHMIPGRHGGGSMQARWGTGIFLGKLWRSDESMIFSDEGKMIKSRSIKLMLEGESWDHEAVDKIDIPRWKAQFVTSEVQSEERKVRGDEDDNDPKARRKIPRDFPSKQEYLDTYGYTEECGRCRCIRRGDVPTQHHTPKCRQRIREKLEKSDDKTLLQEAEVRKDSFFADEIQAAAEMQSSAHYGGNGDPGSSSRGGVEPQGGSTALDEEGEKVDSVEGPFPVAEDQTEDLPVPGRAEDQTEELPVPGRNVRRKVVPDASNIPVEAEEDEEWCRGDDNPDEAPAKKKRRNNRESDRKKRKSDDEGKETKKAKTEEDLFDDFFKSEEALVLNSHEKSEMIWDRNWMKRCPSTNVPWDLESEDVQKRLFSKMRKEKPFCVIIDSIENPSWKNPQKLNEFLQRVCKFQLKQERKFVVVQSLGAPRWSCTRWEELRKCSGVLGTAVHNGPQGKAYRVTTNSSAVIGKVSRLERKTGIDKAISIGCELEVGLQKSRGLPLMSLHSKDGLHVEEPAGHFVDDTTGNVLDTRAVLAGRRLEMKTFEEMQVYEYITEAEAKQDAKGKLVGVRWVDAQKGPIVRSRLVAQEFASEDIRDDLFAATPPLAATKMCLSEAASKGDYGKGDHRVMIMDVKRAFLYGDIEDRVYIRLPKEDPKYNMGLVGRLKKAMYGTRGAPHVWQKMVRRTMTKLGFEINPISPCVYFHPQLDLVVVTHVDDFLCSGKLSDLRWLHEAISKEFDIKSETLGPGNGEVREVQFLGRIIKWTQEGYEYECDPKHAKIMLEEWNMQDSRSVTSPGTSVEKADVVNKRDEEVELDTNEATTYRRAAARINYMALDRPDLGFASKEASRGMAKPTQGDVVRLKRILRYLKGSMRVSHLFRWQKEQRTLKTYSDSDWAGCVKTRRSTSSGAVMSGKHLITHWSSTQATVALSSAEAELNALVKAVSETLGIRNMMSFAGKELFLEVFTDSNAAKGIVQRSGSGKVKHLEAKQLWVQEVVETKEVTVTKVPRELNFSDSLTHHWSASDGYGHLTSMGLEWKS